MTEEREANPEESRPRRPAKERICFVIMPFGNKRVSVKEGSEFWNDGGLSTRTDEELVDFDALYRRAISPAIRAVEGYDITPVRCDSKQPSGSIHKKMIEQIATADIAVVDVTTLNPNVFYELGVRHALKKSVTVLIQQSNVTDHVPFNISGMTVVGYDRDDFPAARRAIRRALSDSLAQRDHQDSLVFDSLDDLSVSVAKPKPAKETERICHEVRGSDCRIGIITGDLANVSGVDIWVNSENTEMMMARYHERALSATIRYMGAKKDRANHIAEDLVNEALEAEMKGAGASCVPAGCGRGDGVG